MKLNVFALDLTACLSYPIILPAWLAPLFINIDRSVNSRFMPRLWLVWPAFFAVFVHSQCTNLDGIRKNDNPMWEKLPQCGLNCPIFFASKLTLQFVAFLSTSMAPSLRLSTAMAHYRGILLNDTIAYKVTPKKSANPVPRNGRVTRNNRAFASCILIETRTRHKMA